MYIGIDVGGTNTRIGLFKSPNELVEEAIFPTERGFEKAIDGIIKNIRGIASNNSVGGIGLCMPGVVDCERGTVKISAQLPRWANKRIVKRLKDEFGCEVKIENDAATTLVAEAAGGYAKEKDQFLFVIWGTGIGGSYATRVGEKLKVISAEIGHQSIDWNGLKCSCGQMGCLENYTAGKAFKKLYGVEAEEVNDSKIWDEVARRFSHGLLNTLHHFPVDLVIFGGGLITKQEHLLERVKRVLEARLKVFPVPELKLAKHGEKTGSMVQRVCFLWTGYDL